MTEDHAVLAVQVARLYYHQGLTTDAIAQELGEALGSIQGVVKIEAAANGYLNLFLDRAYWLQQWLAGLGSIVAEPSLRDKTIVEHTAINPNKAAHIGHLRNATTGDAFGRLLRFQGRAVEIQNYIDDTGVQVADVVVGFRELEQKTLDEVRGGRSLEDVYFSLTTGAGR